MKFFNSFDKFLELLAPHHGIIKGRVTIFHARSIVIFKSEKCEGDWFVMIGVAAKKNISKGWFLKKLDYMPNILLE